MIFAVLVVGVYSLHVGVNVCINCSFFTFILVIASVILFIVIRNNSSNYLQLVVIFSVISRFFVLASIAIVAVGLQ